MPLPATLNEYRIVSPATGRAFFVTAASKEQAQEIFVRRMALLAQALMNKEAA